MKIKKSLAALLSATMALSSQIVVPMSASAADTVTTFTKAPSAVTTTTSTAAEDDGTIISADVTTFKAPVTTTEVTTYKVNTTATEATTFKAPAETTAATTYKANSTATTTEADTSTIAENVTTAASSQKTSSVTTTTASAPKEKLPRVQLEYKGVEVTEAYEETIVLEDGKTLFVNSGEKVLYKDMFKKGNKLDIKGEFAYNKDEDLYINCSAEMAITPCTDTKNDKALAEKIEKMPHTQLEYWGPTVMDSDKDTILLRNGMKVYVSSGKQHYTDMFKAGNMISLVGEFAYDAEQDMYYNVDSEIWLHQYVVCCAFYGEEEEENFVETTTYVEDITVPTSTTTTALEMDEIYYTQPEGKYPVHYQQRVQYRLEKTFTVDKIADYGIYDENGTRWIFDSRDFDIYDLGKGDVIKVSGLFSYGIGGDEFCCYEGGYEVVKYNDNYEQYAQIEILDGLEHRIVDKRLSHYDHIEYKLEFDDVTVVDVNDRETLTLDNGYRIGFCHTSPDLEFVRAGDHISVSGWFVKFDGIDLFGTSYRNSDPEGFGKFKIISRDTDSIHKEGAKPASTGITDMVNLEGVEVTDVADNVITLADGKKYSFNRLASPDVDYVQKGDKIDLIGKFKYNWTTEVYEGTTKASFEIKSRKINVLPENKIKKNIKIENKKIKIDSYRNNVFTDENGNKYYIAPESIFAPQELKTGDTVTINGTFDLFEDEKIYVSYTATIVLDENIKLSDKAGDSNVDGDVNLADSVLIMQTIANPAKYNLTAQGRKNADIEGNKDGITAKDALKIQRITLKLED